VNERRRQQHERRKREKRTSVKGRDWVLAKKEAQRKQGLDVRPDTKYTARKRSGPKW
jgi:18S rRNA (guanine1575-N7)-methyltransferase